MSNITMESLKNVKIKTDGDKCIKSNINVLYLSCKGNLLQHACFCVALTHCTDLHGSQGNDCLSVLYVRFSKISLALNVNILYTLYVHCMIYTE